MYPVRAEDAGTFVAAPYILGKLGAGIELPGWGTLPILDRFGDQDYDRGVFYHLSYRQHVIGIDIFTPEPLHYLECRGRIRRYMNHNDKSLIEKFEKRYTKELGERWPENGILKKKTKRRALAATLRRVPEAKPYYDRYIKHCGERGVQNSMDLEPVGHRMTMATAHVVRKFHHSDRMNGVNGAPGLTNLELYRQWGERTGTLPSHTLLFHFTGVPVGTWGSIRSRLRSTEGWEVEKKDGVTRVTIPQPEPEAPHPGDSLSDEEKEQLTTLRATVANLEQKLSAVLDR
jgi:hypothetical protein